MTRNKKNKRRSGMFSTAKVMKYIRLASLVGPAVHQAMTSKPTDKKVTDTLLLYTGFDLATGRYRPEMLARGWGPFLLTTAITYGVQKLGGLIRRL